MTAIDERPRTVHPPERWNSPYRHGAQTMRIVPTVTPVEPDTTTDTAPIAIPMQVAATGPKHALVEPVVEPEPVAQSVVDPVIEDVAEPTVEPIGEPVVETTPHPVTEPIAVRAPVVVPDAPKRSRPVVAALRRLEAGHWTLIGLVAANATLIPIAIITKG